MSRAPRPYDISDHTVMIRDSPVAWLYLSSGAPATRGAAYCARVDDVGVVRAHHDVPALRRPHRVAVGEWDRARNRAARRADGAVVLLGAVDPVRMPGVDRGVVELGRRLVVDGRPRLAPSKETHAPPSLPSIMRWGSRGSIHRSWLSLWGVVIMVKSGPRRPIATPVSAGHMVSARVGWAKIWCG